ncbi:glutamate carboxypeptidase [Phycisphaerales bacterium]|nr:glutamate carboxypeptidase [Phycisphaerales bacterium]
MALSANEERLCSVISNRRAAMLADLRRLVGIPTGMNHTAGLDESRALLTTRLESLGARVQLVPGGEKPAWIDRKGTPGAAPPTAVCRRVREGVKIRILLCGHIDTVHDPAGSFRELTVSADGTRANGPGCVDMKGGLLVAIHALESLEEAGIAASWGFILNSDEETGSYHSDATIRAEAAAYDVGLVFEPALPDGGLVVERPGSGQFYIETTGVAAHVGRDFKHGVSAIVTMAECVTAIHAMADPDRGLIANVGVIEGGTATNVVPDRCRAWGNVRFRDATMAGEIASRLSSLAQPEAVAGIKVFQSFNRPAKPLTQGTRMLAGMARGAAEDLGQKLPFGKTGGVCDGNALQAAGLATIDTLGVRGGGMHTKDEWMEVASLVERAQLAAVLIARLSEQGVTDA